MINTHYNHKEIEKFVQESNLIHNDEKYILVHLDKMFYIKKFLFDFLNSIKTENYDVAIKKIQKDNALSQSDLNYLNESVTNTINNIVEKKDTKSYIKFSITLIKEHTVSLAADKLKTLFKNTVLYPLFAISLFIIANVFLLDTFNLNAQSSHTNNTIFSVIVILSILLFHEFGHAAASAFFKVKPKEIGFGFYIIFPVFFANVSKIWVLKKKERILVNLGGIYFQLIANILLFILIFILPESTGFLLGIMKLNMFVALYALIPFIRNDGYWIYSDFFDIPNLNKRANSFPFLLYKSLFKKKESEKLSWPFILYSIGNYAFLYVIFSEFIFGAPQIISELLEIFQNNDINTIITAYFPELFKALISVFFIYLILKSFINWLKENIIS